MNEQRSFERLFADRMQAERGSTQLPDAFYDDFRLQARDTRQRPRWLALIKEPPMRISSSLAVGSPMARVVAIMIATLLLALLTVGAGIAGTRLLAADDAIVEAPDDGPTAPTGNLLGNRPDAAYALLLRDTDATVSGLTFRGEPSRVHAKGGSPVLEGLVFQSVGRPYTGASYVNGGAVVSGGSSVTIRDCVFEGGNGVISYDGSAPLVTGNVLTEGANIGGNYGDGTVIRGHQILGGLSDAIGITQPTTALIEGNVLSDTPTGINLGIGSSNEGVDPLVRANSISGGRTGINVGSGAAPTIEENTLVANSTGITLSRRAGAATVIDNDLTDNDVGISIVGSDALVLDNTIQGGRIGVVVAGDATAALAGNTIEGATDRGVSISQQASPTLTENRVCDNGTNLVVDEAAEPIMQDNDICPEPPAPAEG